MSTSTPSDDIDTSPLVRDYERDGVVLIRNFLVASEVAEVRQEIARYIREDLDSKPVDAATREANATCMKHSSQTCEPYFQSVANRTCTLHVGGK